MENDKIHNYLSDVQKKCFEYSDVHIKSRDRYSLYNTIFNITNIIVTTGVATLTATYTSINEKNSPVSIISSILLYCSAVLNSLQQFLNFEKLAEKDRTVAIRFVSLGNNIKKFLTLETIEKKDVIEYFNWASNTFEEILTNTDLISSKDFVTYNLNSINYNGVYIARDTDENLMNFDEASERERVKYGMDRFNVSVYSQNK